MKPTPTSHLDAIRQNDGSYTAFEVADSAPYRILSVTPHFEDQFAVCLHTIPEAHAASLPANPPGATSQPVVEQTLASGNRFMASISADALTLHFDLFDSQNNLISENNFVTGGSPADNFQALKLADVNGDGVPDVVAVFDTVLTSGGAGTVADTNQGGVWTFLGNGNGTFSAGMRQPLLERTGGIAAQALALGDVNGDGKPDLVLGAPNGGSIVIAFGNGDGTFTTQQLLSSIQNAFPRDAAIALADINGDGKLDIALPAATPQNAAAVAVALGNGDGTFQPAAYYEVLPLAGSGSPLAGVSLALGDVNQDGFPDLVTASGTIWLGDGAGGFSGRTDYMTNRDAFVMLADFDADGYTDVILGTGNPGFLIGTTSDPFTTVLFGTGAGEFAGAPVYEPRVNTTNTAAIAAGDFNGDGIPDILVATYIDSTAPQIQFNALLGTGTGQFTVTAPQTIPVSVGQLVNMAAADFNHDGKADIAILLGLTKTSGVVIVLTGQGDGSFNTPVTLDVPAFPTSIYIPDVNGDGIPDLAVASNSNVSVWLAKGDGTFSPPSFTLSVNDPAIAFGDLNGDGKPDLAIANSVATSVDVMPGNGDGTFTRSVNSPLPAPATTDPYGMAAVDANGDGRLDLVMTVNTPGYGDQSTVMLSGDGDGSFRTYSLSSGVLPGFLSADMNGDEIPDLFAYGLLSKPAIRLGNGDGTFQPAVQISQLPGQYVFADFNGDGLPDIAGVLEGGGIGVILNLSKPPAALTVVSAASFTSALAAGSLAAAFGDDLVSGTSLPQFAVSAPLPGSLAGLSIEVKDSTGVTRAAPLYLVASSQINFVVPAGTAAGAATIGVSGPGRKRRAVQLEINPVAPALFSIGSGVAAGYILSPAPTPISAEPLVLNPDGPNYLVLYGSGMDSASAASTTAAIQGVGVPVDFVGPVPGIPGVDQVTLLLPSTAMGSGLVNVSITVGGIESNEVNLIFQ